MLYVTDAGDGHDGYECHHQPSVYVDVLDETPKYLWRDNIGLRCIRVALITDDEGGKKRRAIR